jgi:hypothetical protein
MLRRLSPCIAVILATAISACVSEAPASTAPGTPVASNGGRYTITLTSDPLRRGVNDVTVRVQPSDEGSAAVLSVHAWMPAHGHDAYPVSIVSAAPGVFTARQLAITMPGEWVIDVGLAPSDSAAEDDRATLWASVE